MDDYNYHIMKYRHSEYDDIEVEEEGRRNRRE